MGGNLLRRKILNTANTISHNNRFSENPVANRHNPSRATAEYGDTSSRGFSPGLRLKNSGVFVKLLVLIALLCCFVTGRALQAENGEIPPDLTPNLDTTLQEGAFTAITGAAITGAAVTGAAPAGEQQAGNSPLFSRPLRNRLDPQAMNSITALLPSTPLTPSDPLARADTMNLTEAPLQKSQVPSGQSVYQLAPVKKNPQSIILTPQAIQNPLTQQYIRQYSSPGGLSWLQAVMKRGSPYLAFIRKELAEKNLPEELIYLPVIESGFLVTAQSKSGATGLWQFMKNSMGSFDMRINDWVDERRDFWKSTQGALRKLDENYRYFGDWHLALAAYNAGLGAINRIVQQSGIKDYWVLSQKKLLKTETIHYVPKLLAVIYILTNQRQFNIDPQWPEDPQWEQVAAERSADLHLLADAAGVESGALVSANRELLYNVTPPGQNYYLKVPGKDAEKVAAALSRKDLTLVRYYFHTIHSGDTLLAIALHYGIKVDQILTSNPGIQEKYLKIGSRLIIPALKDVGPYEKPATPKDNLTFEGSHLVKKGETLWSIALGYDVDPETLAEANGMGLTDVLREGKILKTPIK